jgi:predicted nucleotidyltransferase
MDQKIIDTIQKIFAAHASIKLAYLFGSRADNSSGPLSDYDFAIYVDERDPLKVSRVKLALQDAISQVLKTDKIDVVAVNDIQSSEFKYSVITNGKIIYEKEPYRILYETRVLNEYFDFHSMLARYGLTKA